MHYIVNVSGGLTSFEALRRTLAAHGRENTTAVFADTLIEDEDLYRFLDDQERYFGITITRLADGRNPWQVMKDERAIVLRAAGELAVCSRRLKHEVVERWIKESFMPGAYTRVFGMDWSEPHRMRRLARSLAPVPVWFPLAERPYMDKCHIADDLERIGIKVPRLYEMGFTHNNCGGGCVKAGQAHWANLWRTMPERYALWEQKEAEILAHLGRNDIAILRDQGGEKVTSLTLAEFRQKLERSEVYDKHDWGGCGCFAPVPQTRMDDLLLETEVKK